MGKDRLLHKAISEQLNGKNKTNTWGTKVREILDKKGYSIVFNSVTDNGSETEPKGIKSLSNKIKKREEDVFQQKLFCHLEEKRAASEGKIDILCIGEI